MIPSPGADLRTVLKAYWFVERSNCPTYEDFASCLLKAFKVGAIYICDSKLHVTTDWFPRIHRYDEPSKAGEYALIDLTENVTGVEFPAVSDSVLELGFAKEEYETIAEQVNNPPMSGRIPDLIKYITDSGCRWHRNRVGSTSSLRRPLTKVPSNLKRT
jgi:hypothetical protein